MKNKIIEVFKIANRLVSITVENPDFSNLKMNQFVEIGEKNTKFIVFHLSDLHHLKPS